jgi:hypothetical protein
LATAASSGNAYCTAADPRQPKRLLLSSAEIAVNAVIAERQPESPPRRERSPVVGVDGVPARCRR